jgi:hypothetical protein
MINIYISSWARNTDNFHQEWYGWHFPELIRIVSENQKYAQCALAIGDKKTLTDDSLHELAKIVDDDESTAKAIIEAARVSMGQDIGEADMENVKMFAKRTASLAAYLSSLRTILYPINALAREIWRNGNRARAREDIELGLRKNVPYSILPCRGAQRQKTSIALAIPPQSRRRRSSMAENHDPKISGRRVQVVKGSDAMVEQGLFLFPALQAVDGK